MSTYRLLDDSELSDENGYSQLDEQSDGAYEDSDTGDDNSSMNFPEEWLLDGQSTSSFYSDPKEPFQPLYENASVSVCGAYSAVMQLASRHKLSMSAIDDLLALLRLVCPEPNHLPSSLYKFRQYFQQFKGGYKKQVLCSGCHSPLATSKSKCSATECSDTKPSYLIHLPLQKPLETLVLSE